MGWPWRGSCGWKSCLSLSRRMCACAVTPPPPPSSLTSDLAEYWKVSFSHSAFCCDQLIDQPVTEPTDGWLATGEFEFSVALRPQRPYELLGTGSPGRPPRHAFTQLLSSEITHLVWSTNILLELVDWTVALIGWSITWFDWAYWSLIGRMSIRLVDRSGLALIGRLIIGSADWLIDSTDTPLWFVDWLFALSGRMTLYSAWSIGDWSIDHSLANGPTDPLLWLIDW